MQSTEKYELELRQAAAQGSLAEVKKLIPIVKEAGSLNAAGASSGQTALHRAAEKHHDQIISLLLEAGVNPILKDKKGKTAFNLYSEDSPYLLRQDLTNRFIANKPKNTQEALVIQMCKKYQEEGSAKKCLLITPQGGVIFADDAMELARITMPFQQQLYQNSQSDFTQSKAL